MRTIVFEEREFGALRQHLLGRPETEQAAFLLCGLSETAREVRWLVREVVPVPDDGFLVQEDLRLTIDAAFSAAVLTRAEGEGRSVILTHSHPFDEGLEVRYSNVDDAGERLIFRDAHVWAPGRHASMVFGRRAMAAREWTADGRAEAVDRVRVVGAWLRTFDLRAVGGRAPLDEVYDRQVRAFGEAGQRALERLTVGVVGLGGTGSLVSQQLAHLGVGRILGFDHDRLEASNHSRVVGSTPADFEARAAKTAVAARLARAINPRLEFAELERDVCQLEAALELRGCDVVFSCTDNQWSRAVLNQLAQQYLIPILDMGTRIVASGDSVKNAGGRVFVVRPGRGCLLCAGVLDPTVVAREALPPEERLRQVAEGYVAGADVPNPAVISLNSVVAGLAVTEFLDLVTGFMGQQRSLGSIEWEVLKGEVWRAADYQREGCVCARDGYAFAAGDGVRLPCA